jgi:hypothetical protein
VCLFSVPVGFDADDWDGWVFGFTRTQKAGGKECVMRYCITLRSRTDAKITGWYAGSNCLWSTDHNRQKRFDNPRDASTVCHELRSLCPRNAKVINIEVAQDHAHLDGLTPEFSLRRRS